jgi:hypothetical protein
MYGICHTCWETFHTWSMGYLNIWPKRWISQKNERDQEMSGYPAWKANSCKASPNGDNMIFNEWKASIGFRKYLKSPISKPLIIIRSMFWWALGMYTGLENESKRQLSIDIRCMTQLFAGDFTAGDFVNGGDFVPLDGDVITSQSYWPCGWVSRGNFRIETQSRGCQDAQFITS